MNLDFLDYFGSVGGLIYRNIYFMIFIGNDDMYVLVILGGCFVI